MPGVRSVALGAWVRAASLHEPREMGVSHLLEHMVFKGTERRTATRSRWRSRRSAARSTPSRRATTPCYQAHVLDEHLRRRPT